MLSGRVSKKSSACCRCRRQKIRCAGGQPCNACNRRSLICEFDYGEKNVMVKQRYLTYLREKVNRFERLRSGGNIADQNVNSMPEAVEGEEERGFSGDGSESGSSDLNTLVNPISTGPSVFITSNSGRTFYLGVSSNWSFTRRILAMVQEHTSTQFASSPGLIFDSETYDINLEAVQESSDAEPALPTEDYAIYLINTVKFHCCQLFHLFDEPEFMAQLNQFYEQTMPSESRRGVWNHKAKRPPGCEFFLAALRKLPNMVALCNEPLPATEILCCTALYLQCVDHRIAAYNYIGQALRLALSHGMHTDLSPRQVGENIARRYRKVWSTIYVLDREMTSWQGLPPSINDEEVQVPLPNCPDDPQLSRILSIRIKFSRVIAQINRDIYSSGGLLDKTFLLRTKETLPVIAQLTNEIQSEFPLVQDNVASGISRPSAHVHLLYHQCIVLGTRPTLFCFFKARLERTTSLQTLMQSSQTVWSLVKMCLDSCHHIVTILESLQHEGLLDSFLIFDLEALAVASVNILIATMLSSDAASTYGPLFQRALCLLDEFSGNGNRIAALEKSELCHLEQLLAALSSSDPQTPNGQAFKRMPSNARESHKGSTGQPVDPQIWMQESIPETFSDTAMNNDTFDGGLSNVEIMDLANAIDIDSIDWV